MGRCQVSESERLSRVRARRSRAMTFIVVMTILLAVGGAFLDPEHRLSGFVFGALAGAGIAIALLAFPRGDQDYPPDIWDKTLD